MQTIEIERKFLVSGSFPKDEHASIIVQGYLPVKSGSDIRIRAADGQFVLTEKKRLSNSTAEETSCVVPASIGEHLLDLCTGGWLIRKRRHQISVAPHTWEIDEFLDANAGLVIAEIEVSRPDEAFIKPEWLGNEVTSYPEFKNENLFRTPFQMHQKEFFGSQEIFECPQ